MKTTSFAYSTALVVTLAILSAGFTSGCAALVVGGAAAGAGAGAVAYVTGELKSMAGASLERTYNASRAAIKDLRFIEVHANSDALDGSIEARTVDDKKVMIHVKRISDTATDLSIRVGTFGDETLSRQILDQIQKNL
ncbi:MAG TPA: DUF3568 family protein [Candidatus Limnocylindria bacterium]|jgi:hypothetical protein|nr:DUF3568 family protein [Candidatus Limnocylindria bacterium]